MQYSLSGSILTLWHSISPADNSFIGNNYVIPIATEALGVDWYNASPNDIHTIEIQVEDEAGNIREFIFEFRVDFIVPEPVITVQDIGQDTFSNTAFNNRSQLHDADIATTSYTFTNETGKSFLISLSESTTHSVTNTVEQAIREHQIRLKTRTEWRAKFYALGVVQPQQGTWYLTCGLESDWQNISAIKNYDGSSYVVNNVPAPSYGSMESILSDQLRTNPSPTSWAAFHIDGNYMSAGTFDGAVFDYIPAGDSGTAPIRAAYVNNAAMCNFNGNYLQRKNIYTYESLPGYPRNNYSTFTESSAFNTSSLVVEDSLGNIITSTNGWYQIPAGATVTIKKHVKTSVMNVYDDTDVGNSTTFSSYAARKFDKNIAWTVDQGITITRAHDAGFTKTFAMTAYSGPSLPLIPVQACHPFHSKAATDSGESCHPETGVQKR